MIGILLAWAPFSCAPTQEVPVEAVASIAITVSDLDQAIAWYSEVLDFRQLGPIDEHAGADDEALEGIFGLRSLSAHLGLGGEVIELVEYLAPTGRPIPPDSRSQDHWFQHIAIIVRDMDAAYAHLRQEKVEHASSGPQRLPDWNANAGGIQAFYFRDPDAHVLEVLAFPPDKGDPKWHELAQREDRLFLGIDHTAIVVDDTRASLSFYRDLLGMRVAGESENWGTEQEHLNNVFGARLRITALRATAGPGIEFLEYLSPSDGRPFPREARANDLIHWETRLSANDLDGLALRLREARVDFVSNGVTEVESGRALLVRDPDGHAVELRSSASAAGAASQLK